MSCLNQEWQLTKVQDKEAGMYNVTEPWQVIIQKGHVYEFLLSEVPKNAVNPELLSGTITAIVYECS